jgi:hypothetical protein
MTDSYQRRPGLVRCKAHEEHLARYPSEGKAHIVMEGYHNNGHCQANAHRTGNKRRAKTSLP